MQNFNLKSRLTSHYSKTLPEATSMHPRPPPKLLERCPLRTQSSDEGSNFGRCSGPFSPKVSVCQRPGSGSLLSRSLCSGRKPYFPCTTPLGLILSTNSSKPARRTPSKSTRHGFRHNHPRCPHGRQDLETRRQGSGSGTLYESWRPVIAPLILEVALELFRPTS